MGGSFIAAYFAVTHPAVGGLANLFAHPAVHGKLSMLPDFSDTSTAMAVIIVPLAVQWWSAWYPGAEPGGGGYVAQRMLAAKTEKDALKATLFFNVAHYALRPWPWILVALASLIVYPSLESIQVAFPHLDPSVIRNDLAYPAMLVFLPHGILGLVVASLAAAYMSTISTHLNWGASYMVDDVYRRFVARDKSERHYVTVGRVATLVLVILASVVSLWLENALQAFQILLQIGAGTGLVFLLRWFWWRINAWSELAAMVVSFLVAIWFQFLHTRAGFTPMPAHLQLVVGVAITTVGWVAVTLLTPPADKKVLQSFHDHIRPMGPGWRGAGITLAEKDTSESAAAGFLAVFLGCAVIYGALFGTGYALYGRAWAAAGCLVVAAVSARGLLRVLPRVGLR
jgi:SSS family solute:Na+ symporter